MTIEINSFTFELTMGWLYVRLGHLGETYIDFRKPRKSTVN